MCSSVGLVLGDAGEIPLDLEPDDVVEARRLQALELLTQQMARGEVIARAVVEVLVAEYPADARGPRAGPGTSPGRGRS